MKKICSTICICKTNNNIQKQPPPVTEIQINNLYKDKSPKKIPDKIKTNLIVRTNKNTSSSSITDYSLSSGDTNNSCIVNFNKDYKDNNDNNDIDNSIGNDIDNYINNYIDNINSTPRYVFKKYKCSHKQYYVNYYKDEKNLSKIYKIIIFDHYGEDNNKFPIKGWIHHCLHCNTITGRYVKYCNFDDVDICLQLCNKCKQILTYNHKIKPHSVLKLNYELEYDIQKVLREIKEYSFL